MSSLEFHLYRGDFENWARIPIGKAELAEAFQGQGTAGRVEENLQSEIAKAIEARRVFKKPS